MTRNNLFDADSTDNGKKDDAPVERLKHLEDKIASAIEKVVALKNENSDLVRRIDDLGAVINKKDEEMRRLASEMDSIRDQVEELLNELETLEI